VAGYASNFVSSNDLFAPPAAAWTNRESTAQLGIRPAAGGANGEAQGPPTAGRGQGERRSRPLRSAAAPG